MHEPVLIIGGGPVGMTLASELTRYGVRVRIVDKTAHRTDKSKALVLWSRTLELLDRGGHAGAAPFVEAGCKIDGVTFMTQNRIVGRVAMTDVPSPHNYALTIPQAETERLLEERLGQQGVAVERETEATQIGVAADGVDVLLRHSDGREEQVRTPWLIGCDGAHSIVRHALDLPFSGETLLSDWVLADVHMTGYPCPDTEASVYWHKDGVLIIFPIKPGRYRIIGDLPYTEAPAPPTPTILQVQALIDERGPSGTTVSEPIWLAGFRINGRKIADYRHGRVFLAGDAAHIHSPAGGQGMNTGMQDAFNLAWKLALAMHGTCREDLLDSYSPERSQVGDQVLKAAGRLTSVGTLKNPVGQMVRNVAAHVLLGLPQVTHAVADTLSEVAVHYVDSPLNGPHRRGGPQPGERIRSEAPFGAESAPRFVLCGDRTAPAEGVVATFGTLVDPTLRPALQGAAFSLVRPDGYLACSTDDATEVAAYLQKFALERSSAEHA